MENYANISDISALKTLTAEQSETAETLIKTASAKLRVIAKKYGKNFDELVNDEDYAETVKSIVVQAVCRALNNSDTSNINQQSQSALGYSVSMTYVNAGQSLYFLNNELKELGLKSQKFGAIEV